MAQQIENSLESVVINNELFFKIKDVETMRPFFMSIVSNSNHWLFLSSNGGVTAGRKNAQYALFPYYTDDKITESTETTGCKTILKITKDNETYLWEPFSVRSEGRYETTVNLYQNKLGNKIIFEAINHDLQISICNQWLSSDVYGFVKHSSLKNLSNKSININVADGLQNIMPYGVPSDLQAMTSNLVDAYKRAELVKEVGLGVYALSAIIVDKAEPAEALKANTVWSFGFDNPTYLLSSLQLNNFRKNLPLQQEEDVKGEKGAYFIADSFTLNANDKKDWYFVANVNQNVAQVVQQIQQIKTENNLIETVLNDVEKGSLQLQELAAAADGLQYTADKLNDTRHYSNVLFNIMRGGIFDNNNIIEKNDFEVYLSKANKTVANQFNNVFANLNETFTVKELLDIAAQTNNQHFIRLATEYLPLKFSRRHGDPSRPWNQFSINTKNEIDGSKILDYQGNWRDIFQNWESLAHSYPAFIEGMIAKFLNATTFDGYNPYRVTKSGFDWETIEPDNPWSYIGYWGDHQIIYLLKFLEFAEQAQTGFIANKLNSSNYVYANVPYKIKTYNEIVKNSKDTILFDHKAEKIIQERIKIIGADAALLTTNNDEIYTVSFTEKILATTLAKLSNFIPEAGIWMNTQRPEWNDANNALVGNGASMVTLYYLRRFLKFFQTTLSKTTETNLEISEELNVFLQTISSIFIANKEFLTTPISNTKRKEITDALGNAGSDYRTKIYNNSFSGNKTSISTNDVLNFVNNTLPFVEQSIKANKRKDGLYHAYNLVSFKNDELVVDHLSEMLEGQVAVLSSGFLNIDESIEVLNALKSSALYRADQNSYILYPNKQLPKFLDKNNIDATALQQSILLQKLIADNNHSVIEKDVLGGYHFNCNFKNADDVNDALNSLNESYKTLVVQDKKLVLEIFEQVFNHKEFTGRSGTFFAYEGLGSIYWHMISKLCLAVQETCLQAIKSNASKENIDTLTKHYYNVKDGIGVHKSPKVYGAFPITPYSHTPMHKGAQQPGMTGQVKEDILTRIGELGVHQNNGKLVFNPKILKAAEFLTSSETAEFVTVDGSIKHIVLQENLLAFTICQVPVIYKKDSKVQTEIFFANNTLQQVEGNEIESSIATKIFNRTGEVDYVIVSFTESTFINE